MILRGLCAWRIYVRAALSCLLLVAGAAAQRSRITKQVDPKERVTLTGSIHPRTRAGVDNGRVSPSLTLPYLTLVLAPSADQQAELNQLLSEQQNPASPMYHRWLAPEEFAQRFGISDADLSSVKSWLQAQGLTIVSVARGRNWIAFSGNAAQLENAFQAEIHEYTVDGETHYANAAEPSVPAALAPVIQGVRGLNNFRMKPARRGAAIPDLHPDYTSGRGNHYLAPDDFAIIYNVKSLYAAGVDGSGQSIVVAGQTQINLSDIETFRSSYNLPANDPQVMLVPGSRDPGISQNDLQEADLDLEWSGAVARNAKILYVYTYDVMQAVQYAIDQNLAPVVTTSYGLCEAETPAFEVQAMRSWAQQANVQGMTWLAASGDSGGADCDDSANPGLSVDLPAGIPEVTGVGGTEFVEGSSQYWNATNGGNSASAISYIPETTWNDSTTDGMPSASGGGASMLFSKPAWQTGPGVPSDNARHVPDVSLNASADHDGYLVYTGGKLQVFGGTSVPAPSFAGLTALLNQYLVANGIQSAAGLGNINPKLYSLAQTAPSVFHDITTGDNIVTVACAGSRRNCASYTPVGYSAAAGYDQATGLGSVDAYNLATLWNGSSTVTRSTSAMTLQASASAIPATGVTFLIATVTGGNGMASTGTVTFSSGGAQLGSAALTGSGNFATATLAVTGAQLAAGNGAINAAYSGDASVSASVTVSVSQSGSGVNASPAVNAVANAASFKQSVAPGSIVSIFGSQLAPATQTASSIPLPVAMGGVAATVNGIAAPLYYVSPNQVNIQIPYDAPANTDVTLSLNNNGTVVSRLLTVAAAAPGIFTDQNGAAAPNGTAARGEVVTLYVTGAGALTPAVSTGDAPAAGTPLSSLPRPAQATTITVGGVDAPIQFAGVPAGLVGVLQINYQVPASAPAGVQPVVVTVGGVASAAAALTLSN